MQRLPWKICKPYYDALGIQFEEVYDNEAIHPETGKPGRWFGNKAQFEVVSAEDRFPCIIGGERGGKSFATAAILLPHIDLLPEVRRDRFYHNGKCCTPKCIDGKLKFNWQDRNLKPMAPDFVLFGPNYAEPRIEFGYIEDWCRQLGILARTSKPADGPWRLITKSGVVVQTWSTENAMSIRAIDLEGAAACECGAMEYEAIERIQGRIGAKRGFLIYSGTMENAKRWYIKFALEGKRENRYRVKTYSLPSWANRHEFPDGRDDSEIKRWEEFYTEDVFFTRVAAEPRPPRDRVLREINDEHIRKVKLPRNDDGTLACEIEIWADPGYLPSAYAVLWVAHWDTSNGKFFYIFDELYLQEVQTDDILEKIKSHRFINRVKNDGIILDVSAKRHADGNEPAIKIWEKTIKKTVYTKYWHENALIERIRSTAKSGNLAIHPNCRGLIAECGLGEEVFPEMTPWKYRTDRKGEISSEKPEDKWNHAAKALGYGLLRHLGIVERMGERQGAYNRVKNKDRMTPAERRKKVYDFRGS